MIRRGLLAVLAISAVVLIPWTTYLGKTLPASYRADGWRIAWVGFDIGLILLFAAAVVLGRRRRPMAASLLSATAALLVCDAWFDVMLDWGSSAVWVSVASAGLVEIPLAVLLFVVGRQLLSGGVVRHTVTADDARLQLNPATRIVLDALRDRPATLDEIVSRTGLPRPEAVRILCGLQRSQHVRRDWQARWRTVPLSLQRPKFASLSASDREVVEALYDDKMHDELELFQWAARRHLEFGDRVAGSRSAMWLTERELERFDRDYLDLVLRYSMLRAERTAGTHEFAVRWYAFPTPAEHDCRVTAPSLAGVSR